MSTCPAGCGWQGLEANLEYHYRQSEPCRPKVDPPAKRSKQRAVNAKRFDDKVEHIVARELLKAQIDRFSDMRTLDDMLNMMQLGVSLVTEFIVQELAEQSNCKETTEIVEAAVGAFNRLPSVGTLVSRARAGIARADLRTLSTESSDRKGAAFFPAYNLVSIFLQEVHADVRKQVIQSSELWKSGQLYGKRPDDISDVVHGSRFTSWWDVCGKASDAQAKDLRIVLQGWTDEFVPIDGLSQRSRAHKYGVVTAAFVNLPIGLRHYVDFILLLAVYNSKWAKTRGGLSRMLTGIGADGTVHKDGATLAVELKLPESDSPYVLLPNDDEPGGELQSWRLRIFLNLFSFDWLGAGDFGPFATSVSARRPCTKCNWTHVCPCAYLPDNSEKRRTLIHSEHCQGCERRTHSSVLDVVNELRLAPNATQRGLISTRTGIFSMCCASLSLLNDVVRDSTIDVMHLKFCGTTRYLLSWVLDHFIPKFFTWEQLNQEKRKFVFKRGVRVPDLEMTKGSARKSCSIHMNGAQAMYFALARHALAPPLLPRTQCSPAPSPLVVQPRHL